MYFELCILDSVQQHVHAGQVIGCNVLFLPVNFPDSMLSHFVANIQEQRAGTTRKIKHTVNLCLFPVVGSWLSNDTILERMEDII